MAAWVALQVLRPVLVPNIHKWDVILLEIDLYRLSELTDERNLVT